MTGRETFEIRARPPARSVRSRLLGLAALVALGVVVSAVGTAMLVQQRRLLWPGALVRLDADGVHARRDAGFASLSWDRIASVR